MGNPLLECSNVRFSYERHRVLDGVSLSLPEGGFVGIIGPNGSGKSTLVRIFSGALTPLEGTVLLDGKEVSSLTRRRMARELAVASQEESPDFGFSVWEEVMLGRSPHHRGLHFENRGDRTVVERALEKTGITHVAERRISELSGGERQRARIARALAQEPRVILMDEPTNHLDLHAQLSLMDLMREINEEGVAILLVSHDINFVARTAADVKILYERTFRFSGTPAEVITEEHIAETFNLRALVDVNPGDGSPRMTPIERLPA
jgi:iron complex transport system ATP-binding protein